VPDQQQIMVRRAIGIGGIAVVLLLLVLGIKACADSAKESGLRDYNTAVASLAQDSDTQISKPFFQLLSNTGRSSPVDVESQVNQYRATAEDLAKRARGISVPDEMTGVHQQVETALDLRAGALGKIADNIRAALGTGQGADAAVQKIAGQMQAFLASDVLWSQRVKPLIGETLDANGVTGQTTPVSTFLPDLGWLDPNTVGQRIGAQGATNTSGPAAPGTHGHGLVSVSVGPTTLQPGSVNRIPAASPPTFTVKLQNQGENDESNVTVSARISGAGSPISAKKIIPKTTAGQPSTVEITLPKRPPVGTPVTITVAVAPVKGEKTTDNNKQDYPALFTR
jgi:hypothetical protein